MSISSTTEQDLRHKQVMERMYRVQRHIYDATRAYYLLGRDEMIANLKPPFRGTILEIGCGTGRNLIRIANAFSDAQIHGMDISDEMLVSAGQAVHKHNYSSRIRLAQGDAATFKAEQAFGVAQFDRICFSYTLSMIPDWQGALRNAASLLAPGGELHIVDFGSCNNLPFLFKAGLATWLKQFHVTPRADLLHFAQQLSSEHALRHSSWTTHRGYAQHVVVMKLSSECHKNLLGKTNETHVTSAT